MALRAEELNAEVLRPDLRVIDGTPDEQGTDRTEFDPISLGELYHTTSSIVADPDVPHRIGAGKLSDGTLSCDTRTELVMRDGSIVPVEIRSFYDENLDENSGYIRAKQRLSFHPLFMQSDVTMWVGEATELEVGKDGETVFAYGDSIDFSQVAGILKPELPILDHKNNGLFAYFAEEMRGEAAMDEEKSISLARVLAQQCAINFSVSPEQTTLTDISVQPMETDESGSWVVVHATTATGKRIKLSVMQELTADRKDPIWIKQESLETPYRKRQLIHVITEEVIVTPAIPTGVDTLARWVVDQEIPAEVELVKHTQYETQLVPGKPQEAVYRHNQDADFDTTDVEEIEEPETPLQEKGNRITKALRRLGRFARRR